MLALKLENYLNDIITFSSKICHIFITSNSSHKMLVILGETKVTPIVIIKYRAMQKIKFFIKPSVL